MSTKELSTQEKIDILFDNFKEFLKEKNRRYGDSALNPILVFSKAGAEQQLCNRLDDKLQRIQNSPTLRKNDVGDCLGYLALICVQNDWLDFDEFLD